MSRINLLSWRKQSQRRCQKIFFIHLLSTMMVALIILLLMHKIIAKQSKCAKGQNAILSIEIARFNQQLQQNKLQQQRDQQLLQVSIFVETLQKQQQKLAELFTILPKIMPQDLYLIHVKINSNEIILTGKTTVHSAVSLLMKQLEILPWLSSVKLISMHDSADRSTETDFKLNIFL